MKELRKTIDWEHSLLNKIDRNKDKENFPAPGQFGITEDEVKEYAYDLQRILDREEERKSKLVLPGIILVLPPIVLSAFRNDTTTLLLGVAIGLVLVFAYYSIMRFIDRKDIKKMRRPEIDKYIQAVMDYDDSLNA